MKKTNYFTKGRKATIALINNTLNSDTSITNSERIIAWNPAFKFSDLFNDEQRMDADMNAEQTEYIKKGWLRYE